MNLFRAPIIGLGLCALGACNESNSSAGFTNPGSSTSTATSLGLAVIDIIGDGDLWITAASEPDQGVDLNGDGDALDTVLFALEVAAGRLTNLALAVSGVLAGAPRLVDDLRAAFVVGEAAQGADLNGDGDALDGVLHLFDVRKATVENLGLALSTRLSLEGGLLMFGVDEASQGARDLDGDGDATGLAAFVRDFTRGTTLNLRHELGSPAFHAVDRRAAFYAAETSATGDLNGDGDTSDAAVLSVYDGVRGFMVESGLATNGERALFASGFFVVLLSEAEQRVDANGDGDFDDLVFHDFDPITGLVRNLGLEGAPPSSIEGNGALGLLVVESLQSGDLNSDGDRLDTVPFVHEPLQARIANVGVAVADVPVLFFLGRSLAVIVSESRQGGRDLNRDGDALDLVPHVFDLVNGTTENLGVEGSAFLSTAGRLLIARSEAEANVDWNGDGDRLDVVLFVWHEATNQITNTRFAASALFDALGDTVLLGVSEAERGADLNGDGDDDDLVLAAFDLARNASTLARLAVTKARLLSETQALALAGEAEQGADLNGDGDELDQVLHRVELTF